MKFLVTILSLMMLTSCSPAEIPQENEMPTPPQTEQPEQPEQPNPPNSNSMKVTIGNSTFTATLATNATATAFKTMMPQTFNMSDFNSNEKVGTLPNSLTTVASNPGTIHSGDIMLYGSSSLVLFYETFSTSYSYTRIGHIDNIAGLKAALGSASVTITFELE